MEHIVEIRHGDRPFSFRPEADGAWRFWRVESEGRVWHSPVTVSGDEAPAFFEHLARTARRLRGW